MDTSKYLNNLLLFLFVVFFISLACCFRAITSISIGLLLVTNIAKYKIDTGSFINPCVKNNFLIGCCIFYLLQSSLIIISPNHSAMMKHLGVKASIAIVPIMVCCNNYLNPALYRKLMKYLTYILAGAMLFCLLAAFRSYYLHKTTNVFFYHDLISPFKHHAIQVSILLYIVFVHLLEISKKGIYLFNNRLIHFLMVFYFVGCLLLLSSKLVITFTIIAAFYYLLLNFKNIRSRVAGFATLLTALILIIIVLSGSNKISKRFNEITHTNLSLVQQKTFNPGIYFDGIQFRLLQLRFVKEILDEKHAWLTGVSDDAQALLDEKYISTNMYLGNGTAADHGYLDYNTHNEFLESLLQSGLWGLVIFSLICVFMIQLLIHRPGPELFFVVAILLAYSLNESVFQRQYSITIFTFFPLFIYFSTDKQVRNTIL